MAEASPPTQDQLHQLRETILSYEPDIQPFDGIPGGIDLRNFETLTAPPTVDETSAPAATLKAPDKRVIWLSVFRNPDTNAIVKPTIMILDPSANLGEREEIPQENYELLEGPLGWLAIEHCDAPAMTATEVAALQELIDRSEVFDPFV